MSSNSNQKAKINRGILNSPSGTLENMVITKRGVIYFRRIVGKRKKNT
jgi:hypothetical protein